MALQHSSESAFPTQSTPRHRELAVPVWPGSDGGLTRRVAQVVSHVASPPVLAAASAIAAAGVDGRPVAFLAAGLLILVAVVLPLATLVRQFRTGIISDLEVTRRQERLWPLLLTTTCVGSGAVLLLVIGAPPSVAGLGAILGVQSLLLLAVTGSWKISVHACAAASAGALCWLIAGRLEPGLVLVGLMIWSRLALRRHSPAQCLAGAALGAGSLILLWPLLAG